jgi:glycosyltransferase involved in cell wall biosynthesis
VSATLPRSPAPGAMTARTPTVPSAVSRPGEPAHLRLRAPDGAPAAPGARLRVALVVPPWFDVPPAGYGGIEWMCHWLAEGLAARGHEVFVIGTGVGNRPGFLSTGDRPAPCRLGEPLPEVLHAAGAAEILADLEPDVVHDHTLAGPLLALGRATPTVVTAHGPVEGEIGRYYQRLGNAVCLVAISAAQRRSGPDLPWAATVPNGIPVEDYPFCRTKEDYVAFLGRMSPDKGAHLAIDAARAAGIDIVVAAKCNEAAEHAYFEAEIRPRLGAGVTWVGEADADAKRALLARARALVLPLCWEEPFGIVMVEALACGTPVIALARGAASEIVAPGAGYLCSGVGELPGAIEAAASLDPATCRAAAWRFDAARMVEAYESLYMDLAGRPPVVAACSMETPPMASLAPATAREARPELRMVGGGRDPGEQDGLPDEC